MSPRALGNSSPSGEGQGLERVDESHLLSDPGQTGLEGAPSNDGDDNETSAGGSDDDTSSDESQKDTSGNKPNIMFVGKEEVVTIVDGERKAEMKPRTPPTHIQNGMEKINLPSREAQQTGPFYHEKADSIIQLFPSLYKHYK